MSLDGSQATGPQNQTLEREFLRQRSERFTKTPLRGPIPLRFYRCNNCDKIQAVPKLRRKLAIIQGEPRYHNPGRGPKPAVLYKDMLLCQDCRVLLTKWNNRWYGSSARI